MSENQIYTYSYNQRFQDGETVNVQVRGTEQGIANYIQTAQPAIWKEYDKSNGRLAKLKPLKDRETVKFKNMKIVSEEN